MMKLLVLALSFLLLGCSSGPSAWDSARTGLPSPTIGILRNPYANDQNLAAVTVIQGPANPYDRWGFAHTLPSSVSFAFWAGRVRQVQLRGDGTVWDSFWWPPKAWLKPGSTGWAGFDFMYGSDPTFVRHRDPRLPAAAPTINPAAR